MIRPLHYLFAYIFPMVAIWGLHVKGLGLVLLPLIAFGIIPFHNDLLHFAL